MILYGSTMKQIPQHPKYEVSVDGVVQHIERKQPLKHGSTQQGYKLVCLSMPDNPNGGHNKAEYVHRLVAMTYLPNPENKEQVNHIDGDITNNHVSNLEWMTASENQRHSREVLGRLGTPKMFNEQDCEEIKLAYAIGKENDNLAKIELDRLFVKLINEYKASKTTTFSLGKKFNCCSAVISDILNDNYL